MNIEHQVSLSHWGVFVAVLDHVLIPNGKGLFGVMSLDGMHAHEILEFRPLNSFDNCEYDSKFKQIERN